MFTAKISSQLAWDTPLYVGHFFFAVFFVSVDVARQLASPRHICRQSTAHLGTRKMNPNRPLAYLVLLGVFGPQ